MIIVILENLPTSFLCDELLRFDHHSLGLANPGSTIEKIAITSDHPDHLRGNKFTVASIYTRYSRASP